MFGTSKHKFSILGLFNLTLTNPPILTVIFCWVVVLGINIFGTIWIFQSVWNFVFGKFFLFTYWQAACALIVVFILGKAFHVSSKQG